MNSVIAAAVERYIDRPHPPKRVPDMTGDVHALLANRKPTTLEVWFARRYSDWYALCGVKVKAILPGPWSEDRPGVCDRCAEILRVHEYAGTSPTGIQIVM